MPRKPFCFFKWKCSLYLFHSLPLLSLLAPAAPEKNLLGLFLIFKRGSWCHNFDGQHGNSCPRKQGHINFENSKIMHQLFYLIRFMRRRSPSLSTIFWAIILMIPKRAIVLPWFSSTEPMVVEWAEATANNVTEIRMMVVGINNKKRPCLVILQLTTDAAFCVGCQITVLSLHLGLFILECKVLIGLSGIY